MTKFLRIFAWEHKTFGSQCETEIREFLLTTLTRYFPQHVLLCTRTVHDQSGDISIQGYLRMLWIGNAKALKNDNIHKLYVLLEYFFKSGKT